MFLFNLVITIITIFTRNILCFIPLYPSIGNIQQQTSTLSESNIPSEFEENGMSFNEAARQPQNIYDLSGVDAIRELQEYDNTINKLQTPNDLMRMLHKLQDDIKTDQEIATKSEILLKILEDPNISTLPIVYVEDEPEITDDEGMENDDSISSIELRKRSRYYRRYPGKRHSRNRSNYEPDLRYLCVPSREDVFKLLVGIHENRNGNHRKTIQFCNRKRPAKAIFTNIRFLG